MGKISFGNFSESDQELSFKYEVDGGRHWDVLHNMSVNELVSQSVSLSSFVKVDNIL